MPYRWDNSPEKHKTFYLTVLEYGHANETRRMERMYQKKKKIKRRKIRRAVYRGISEKLYETKKMRRKTLACHSGNKIIFIALKGCVWGVSMQEGEIRGNNGLKIFDHYNVFHLWRHEWVIKIRKRHYTSILRKKWSSKQENSDTSKTR